MKIIHPTIRAAIAVNNTAAAAKSFTFFIMGFCWGLTKSQRDSIAELKLSAAKTMPQARAIAIHSLIEILNHIPAAITKIVTQLCILALCSYLKSILMPLKAYPKLRTLFFKEKYSCFMVFYL